MNRTLQRTRRLTFLPLACGIVFIRAAEMRLPLPPETSKLRPGSGSELAAAQCLLCHSADYISTQPRLSPAAWKATVLKMQQRYGAPIQTNNMDALVEYLAKTYGLERAGSPAQPGK